MAVGKRRSVASWAMAVGILTVFLVIVGCAKLSGHWQSDIPQQVYFNLVPRSGELVHP